MYFKCGDSKLHSFKRHAAKTNKGSKRNRQNHIWLFKHSNFSTEMNKKKVCMAYT